MLCLLVGNISLDTWKCVHPRGLRIVHAFIYQLILTTGYDLINKNNARYLLAGYNTMSEEKRKKFPIDSYLVFFKKFFTRMSIFSLLSALLFHLIFEVETAVMIWAIFQIIPYVYFVFQSLKY